jgi:hypothetical protein
LKQLVTKSYRDNQLDAETVGLIADHLNRQMLKQYITLLNKKAKKPGNYHLFNSTNGKRTHNNSTTIS